MVRRNDSTQETRLLPLLVATPDPAAGRRWTIGESFESANGQAGLDEHQVRT
jgi:hypothetical protein